MLVHLFRVEKHKYSTNKNPPQILAQTIFSPIDLQFPMMKMRGFSKSRTLNPRRIGDVLELLPNKSKAGFLTPVYTN